VSKVHKVPRQVILLDSSGNNTIEKNKKVDIVRPRQKFAPFTKAERKKRRNAVYKLHFEHGMPATKISELMKVDRNTINNDLKFLYRQALNDYNLDDMSLEDILEKQLVRLETQRDRLGIYLNDSKDVTNKVTIERLIADIDFRVLTSVEKINHNTIQFYDQIIKAVNNIAENKKLDVRFTSLFELRDISIKSRINLNKLKENTLNRNRRMKSLV
jgi:polynucleotide 5'-kinase involved in rRNA processing